MYQPETSKKFQVGDSLRLFRVSRHIQFFGLLLFMVLTISAGQPQTSFREKLNVTYQIKNIEMVANADKYIAAMNASDFSGWRLRDSRFTIRFVDGVQIELLSAAELKNAGIVGISLENYPVNWNSKQYLPTFRLAENNFIIEEHEVAPMK